MLILHSACCDAFLSSFCGVPCQKSRAKAPLIPTEIHHLNY